MKQGFHNDGNINLNGVLSMYKENAVAEITLGRIAVLPVWSRVWFLSVDDWLNDFLQYWHSNGFSSVCILMWERRLLRELKPRRQTVHRKRPGLGFDVNIMLCMTPLSAKNKINK